MSEISNHHPKKTKILVSYASELINGGNGAELVKKYNILEGNFDAIDVLAMFDELFNQKIDIEKLKIFSNKLFNILYKQLSEPAEPIYQENSIFSLLKKDNAGIRKFMTSFRPQLREYHKNPNKKLAEFLTKKFNVILKFTEHYIVMQNIVFPYVEKNFEHYDCIKIMWSFHDDIIKNIKHTLKLLESPEKNKNLFNQISSKLFFNIFTIIFREEKIIFPNLSVKASEEDIISMRQQLNDFKLAFVRIPIYTPPKKDNDSPEKLLKLSTGEISLEQLELIFKHLPVDMTYVDENDNVRFFSAPKARIFPRTTGIIGRSVQNCHPHESVDIVNKIIKAFKNGEKDNADFWIKMGKKFVYIRYFAVRDNNNNYKGVLEVTQEISDIQKLKGERRLLDW